MGYTRVVSRARIQAIVAVALMGVGAAVTVVGLITADLAAIAIGVVLILAGWAVAVGREIRHTWRG